jgi:hypothetical protein
MSQAGGGDHMKYIKGNTQSFITRLLQQLSAISTAPGAMFPLQEEHLGVRSWSPHSCAGNFTGSHPPGHSPPQGLSRGSASNRIGLMALIDSTMCGMVHLRHLRSQVNPWQG